MSERGWLAGPEAKLDRAIEHLETLESECGRFLKAQPYSVSTEFEPGTAAMSRAFTAEERFRFGSASSSATSFTTCVLRSNTSLGFRGVQHR